MRICELDGGRRAKTLQIDPPDSGRAAAIRPAGHRAEPARRSNGRALRPAVIPPSHGALAAGHGIKPANADTSADLKAAANRRCRAFFTADKVLSVQWDADELTVISFERGPWEGEVLALR